MKLEKAKEQSKAFKCIYEKTIVNIMYTNNQVQSKMHSFFGDYNITLQQYNILRILRGAKGPLSTSKIRERMLDKMSDTSRLVKRLLQKDLVKRESCCFDRRLVDVQITSNGQDLLVDIDNKVGALNKLLCSLTIDECNMLGQLLDKINCTDENTECQS